MANPNIWSPGVSISAESSIEVERFVASAGQTLFELSTYTYVSNVGSLHVFVNGVYQVAGVDFEETSGTSFTLYNEVSAGTIVVALGFIEITSGSAAVYAEQASQSAIAAAASAEAAEGVFAQWETDVFDGDGRTQAFHLSHDPASINNCFVSVSGVTQVPGIDFTLSSLTIRFLAAPPTGTKITVRYGRTLASRQGVVSWGSISGTITNQADLVLALSGKANSSHTHTKSDLSGVVVTVNGKFPDINGNVVIPAGGNGTVTSVSVKSANGFAGSVDTATSTPAITLSTGVTGLLYGNGTSIQPVTIGSNLTFSGGTLSASTGGSMTYPSGSGIPVVVSGTSWGTTLTIPSGALVGTTANQALTNKTYEGITFSGTASTTMTFPAENASVGFRNIPQNSKSAAYTCVLADSGKHIFHPAADTTARTWTIPANASVAYPIGTSIMFVNEGSAGVITIAITSDTMVLAGAGTTGNRTLAANGVATATKITSTKWIIYGTGLT